MMSRNFTPEQELIDQLVANDATALEELTNRYSYSLYTYCMAKLNSREDARRIVRNLFISLWEDRHHLPGNFSLSLHLYTEVRKGVVQCVNSKLKTNQDLPVFEKNILPGFSADQLQQAAQPSLRDYRKLGYRSLPSPRKQVQVYWWEKYTPAIHLKGLRKALQGMVNIF